MFQFFRQRFDKQSKDSPTFASPVQPVRLLYVVGDVHGCDDLLAALLENIEKDAADRPYDMVTVGDYIDRGEQSAAVLRRLHALSNLPHVGCLMGNHERMLLDFLGDPAENGRRWIRNGGLQTLASFGVGGITETSPAKAMTEARNKLRHALGPLEEWLNALPLTVRSGNILIAHAGMDPRVPADEQADKTLLWGHPDFFKRPREDGMWVVHGHTVVTIPKAEQGRISVDTGAYATGTLTAAQITSDGVRFVCGAMRARNPDA